MIPEQTFTDFPIFANNGSKVKPEDAKYSEGYVPADVLPAQHANWLFNKASSAVEALNAGLESTEAEIRSVITAAGATPDVDTNNQMLTAIQNFIATAKAEAILAAHPIGSLYWSSKATDPGTLFGGTWTRVKDAFIYAGGDDDTVNSTGGTKTVTLTVKQIPSHTHTGPSHTHTMSHTHSVTASGTISGHTHTMSHTHSVTASGSISGHTHTMAHTHSVTASGTISVTTNPSFTGSAVTSGGSSAANTGNESATHTHSRGTMNITGGTVGESYSIISKSGSNGAFTFDGLKLNRKYGGSNAENTWASYFSFDASKSWTGATSTESANHTHTMAHTHSVTASGSISGGAYTFTGSAVTSGTASATNTGSTTPTFTGSAVTSGAASATNTGSTTPTFTGSEVTSGGASATNTGSAGTGNTGSTGGGEAHNNMPPYIVKYCWERTA